MVYSGPGFLDTLVAVPLDPLVGGVQGCLTSNQFLEAKLRTLRGRDTPCVYELENSSATSGYGQMRLKTGSEYTGQLRTGRSPALAAHAAELQARPERCCPYPCLSWSSIAEEQGTVKSQGHNNKYLLCVHLQVSWE